MISETAIHTLNSIPLADVMRANGYAAERKSEKATFYKCPFHVETNGSFSVDARPAEGKAYAGFNCYGCGVGGWGAIMLQQKLLGAAYEKSDFLSAVRRLSSDFGIDLEGAAYGNEGKAEFVRPQETFTYKLREGAFTNMELNALGCQSLPVGYDEEGNVLYKYSFGKDYYRKNCPANNFDSTLLTKMFNLYPLESYIYPAKPDKNLRLRSQKISSSPGYPIFLFHYPDEKGGWFARKYEPYSQPKTDSDGKKRPAYKFAWWKSDGYKPDYAGQLYGDNDVMEALRTGNVKTSDEEGHPVVLVERKEDGQRINKRVFRRIVICSGPRDAINVYFHSDAHVVFPHSESVEITDATIRSLFDVACSVYVLYDIDKTGIEQMHRLALRHIDLKVIYLPETLKEEYNPRSRKQCKDAEEFFNFYPNVMRRDSNLCRDDVNSRFLNLLHTAKSMRFWKVERHRKTDEEKQEYINEKYTINFETMSQFLSANGFFRYRDEAQNQKFVHVKNNIVEVVDERDSLPTARGIMKRFLENNTRFYNEDLLNAISTQRKVGKDSMSDIRETRLNFCSWGEDYDHFFFKNCAVKVTAEGLQPVDYKDLDFCVNRLAIKDFNYTPVREPLFEIVKNPEYAIAKERFDERMADKKLTEDERNAETARFTAYERLWRYKLKFNKPMEELPPTLQLLYDTSRVHWKKEEVGMPLTAEEKQRQDMHFVSKVSALGYLLSRYRTGVTPRISFFTDYSVADEGRSNGGTGKSFMLDLLSVVRNACYVPGKGLKTKENFARNFAEFKDTIDSVIFIDDLRKEVSGDEFFNASQRITIKTLYNNEVTLPPDRTPKICVTSNSMSFDLNEPSTARRVHIGMFSDYYHPENYSGGIREVTPYTKFGKDIIKNATEEELNLTAHWMMQCCQFYLANPEPIIPPMERDGVMRIIYSSLKDALFIEWANKFFADPWHFCRPLSLQDVVMSYLNHRGEEVTTVSIKRTREELMKKIRLYCLNMQYVVNPRIVYRADKGNWPRHYAWETPFVGDRPAKAPREKKHTRVLFFYRVGEEPKELKEILPCPDEDMEARNSNDED